MSSARITTVTNCHDPKLVDGSDYEVIGKVLVESGEMASLVVGIFEKDFPQPSFHIEVEPQIAISSSLVRVNDNGEYKLTYHFQNFQDMPCEITVRRCDFVN